MAVLSCLGDYQGDKARHWYIEAAFTDDVRSPHQTFADLAVFED